MSWVSEWHQVLGHARHHPTPIAARDVDEDCSQNITSLLPNRQRCSPPESLQRSIAQNNAEVICAGNQRILKMPRAVPDCSLDEGKGRQCDLLCAWKCDAHYAKCCCPQHMTQTQPHGNRPGECSDTTWHRHGVTGADLSSINGLMAPT